MHVRTTDTIIIVLLYRQSDTHMHTHKQMYTTHKQMYTAQGRIEGGFLGFQETPFDNKTFLQQPASVSYQIIILESDNTVWYLSESFKQANLSL